MERRLMKIGGITFTVYGSERAGWSPDPMDFATSPPLGARYASLAELYFALTTLCTLRAAEV